MNELALLVKGLEDQLIVCIKCGTCQSVCPLFEQTGKEADVARGKLALLDGLMTKLFTNPEGVNTRLNKCLLCGSCAANCPSGVNIIEIFIRARAILAEYKGLSPVKQIIFKQMLSKPKTFDAVFIWAEKFQKFVTKSNKTVQGTSCTRFISPLLKHRNFIPMAKKPFHLSVNSLDVDSGKPGIKIAFFTGCLIDKFMPQIGEASIKVFHQKKVNVFIPKNQGCCGIPALASGERQTFITLLEYNINLFREHNFDYLITACATCTTTIKKLWPSLYQGNDEKYKTAIDEFSKKTMDINQFLIDVMKINQSDNLEGSEKPPSKTVTYHDPCHLKKSLGIYTQPRQLIIASGHELKEMNNADKCCGMGGSFNLFHYDISTKIGILKQNNIIDSNCSTIASGCPACLMQIRDMLSKHDSNIRVKHPIELYADSLKI